MSLVKWSRSLSTTTTNDHAYASSILLFLDDVCPVVEIHVLTKLSAIDRGLFSRVMSFGCCDAVITFNLPHACASCRLLFKVEDFVDSFRGLCVCTRWSLPPPSPILAPSWHRIVGHRVHIQLLHPPLSRQPPATAQRGL